MPSQDLPVLGWKEHGSLPAWGVTRLRVKLDTGARTSALHVEDLDELGSRPVDGAPVDHVGFTILVGSRDHPRRVRVEAPVAERREVRDTGARAEVRPFVRTRVVVGPLDLELDVTLTDRTGMNFRMLLGRTAMAGRCLVDPAAGYLHSTPPPPRVRR